MQPSKSKALLPTPPSHMRIVPAPSATNNAHQTLNSSISGMSCHHITQQFKHELEQILNFPICNVSLYQQAFIHKSLLSETNCSNERLEFLGDSVLNMIIAEYLYHRFSKEDEGFLTKLRSKLVNCENLTYMTKKMKIDKFIITSKQVNDRTKGNTKLLEDAFEALIGAIYLDKGWEQSQLFIIRAMEEYVDFRTMLIDDNYKDILLKYTQKVNMGLPTYVDISCEGPPHDRLFTCAVIIEKQEMGRASGKTKKQAEKMAARVALGKYNVDLSQTIRTTIPKTHN